MPINTRFVPAVYVPQPGALQHGGGAAPPPAAPQPSPSSASVSLPSATAIERNVSPAARLKPQAAPLNLGSARTLDESDQIWTVHVPAGPVRLDAADIPGVAGWHAASPDPYMPVPFFERRAVVDYAQGGANFRRVIPCGLPLQLLASVIRVRAYLFSLDYAAHPGVDPRYAVATPSIALGHAPPTFGRWIFAQADATHVDSFWIDAAASQHGADPRLVTQLYIHNPTADARFALVYDWPRGMIYGGDGTYIPAGGPLWPWSTAIPGTGGASYLPPLLSLPVAANSVVGLDLSTSSGGLVFHEGILVVGSTTAPAVTDPKPMNVNAMVFPADVIDPLGEYLP